MKKVMLFLMLAVFTLSMSSFNADPEPYDPCEYEANMAWAETFIETGDYWAAESAALEAESDCRDIVEVEEFLDGLD